MAGTPRELAPSTPAKRNCSVQFTLVRGRPKSRGAKFRSSRFIVGSAMEGEGAMEADTASKTRGAAGRRCATAARRANMPAGSRREFSTRRAVFFSSAASRARASMRSPRRLRPGSRRSTRGFPVSRRCSPPSSSASCGRTQASTPCPAPEDSIEERLDALAALILTRVLAPETIGLDPGRGRRSAALSRSRDERQLHGAPTPDRSGGRACLANWPRPTRLALRPHSRRTSSWRRRAGFSTSWSCRC